MGPDRTHRTLPRRSLRTLVLGTGTALVVLVLSGCSREVIDQWGRGGLPESSTVEGPMVEDLWVGYWIAAVVVGVIVWGLILWACVAYRRRGTDLPPQFRYNMPIEAFYTLAPLIVIAALFTWTVRVQNDIVSIDREPDLTVAVIGQQWSWTFNYVDSDVYEIGTAAQNPTLYLPVDQRVEFELRSPDVNHGFWVPSFYFKMDVIPGRLNTFQATPDTEGTYVGKCTELCGSYHSRMLFTVKIVSEQEYEERMQELRDRGQTGYIDAPLRGAYAEEPLTEEKGANEG